MIGLLLSSPSDFVLDFVKATPQQVSFLLKFKRHFDTPRLVFIRGVFHPWGSFVLEQLALDDLMDERSQSIILGSDSGDDGVNLRLIGLRRRRAGGVTQQLFSKGA